jgi:hypothetical protein
MKDANSCSTNMKHLNISNILPRSGIDIVPETLY